MGAARTARGTVLAVLVLGVAYVARGPIERAAVDWVGPRAAEGGELEWVSPLASALVIAAGLVVAGAILRHYRPDPAARLAAWAASAGLRRVREREGPLREGTVVTRLLRPGRRRCVAAFEGEASIGTMQVSVITARGPRSWFPLGQSDDSPPRTVTQIAVTGLGELATFTIEPLDALSPKERRKLRPTVTTESIEFGRMWLLRGTSPRAIHACLTPTVMARLMEEDAQGLIYEFAPGTVLTAVADVLSVGHQLERRLMVLQGLVRHVPRYLTERSR